MFAGSDTKKQYWLARTAETEAVALLASRKKDHVFTVLPSTRVLTVHGTFVCNTVKRSTFTKPGQSTRKRSTFTKPGQENQNQARENKSPGTELVPASLTLKKANTLPKAGEGMSSEEANTARAKRVAEHKQKQRAKQLLDHQAMQASLYARLSKRPGSQTRKRSTFTKPGRKEESQIKANDNKNSRVELTPTPSSYKKPNMLPKAGEGRSPEEANAARAKKREERDRKKQARPGKPRLPIQWTGSSVQRENQPNSNSSTPQDYRPAKPPAKTKRSRGGYVTLERPSDPSEKALIAAPLNDLDSDTTQNDQPVKRNRERLIYVPLERSSVLTDFEVAAETRSPEAQLWVAVHEDKIWRQEKLEHKRA